MYFAQLNHMFFLGPRKDQDLIRYYSYQKNQSKKAAKTSSFNRFVLLGVDREQVCVAVFTDNIDHTKTLFQYFPKMQPGTKVSILNPRLRGYIGETNTVLVTTSQPLIPHCLHEPTVSLPPKPLTENEDYSYFNFSTKDLTIANSTYIVNACNGVLCDGTGNKNEVCGCISSNNRAVALYTELYCSEFEMLDRVDVPIVSFTSVSLGELVLAEKFDVLALPPHDVDDGIRMLATAQRVSGFRIIGWCRAPKESDNSISDAKVMHVVSCLPEGGKFSEIAKEKLLKLPAPSDTDDIENENNNPTNTSGFSGAATAQRFGMPAPPATGANEKESNNPPTTAGTF